MKLTMAAVLSLFSASCQGTWLDTDGGRHKKGERMASARAFYSEPITGKALAWHGLGDVPNFGVSAHNHWFWEDRLAIGIGLSLINFKPPGRDAVGGEFEGRLRYFFSETENAGFFMDLNGGYMRTEAQMPPGATRNNFTFSFGPGVEVPLSADTSLLLGVEFHHMSNALGRESPRNPSQNEALLWAGFGVRW